MNDSEILLDNAERYGLVLATSRNNPDVQDTLTQSRPNIGKIAVWITEMTTFLHSCNI